jgi:hypothetical protein
VLFQHTPLFFVTQQLPAGRDQPVGTATVMRLLAWSML